MRYIRTKDGKVKKSKDFTADELWNYENETDNILKQADTIEELCDEFVVVIENKQHLIPREWLKQEIIVDVLYGAIWTDKGLIYVAKMNDKGELELL